MTQLLESVIKRISGLSEERQNSLASFMLAELESENKWDSLFASSPKLLAKLAGDALAEFEQGQTEHLDLQRDFPKD
jgi:hypothetical protein